MKKLLLATLLLAAPAMATQLESGSKVKNVAGAKAAAKLVKIYGYRCDSISSFMQSPWSGDFTLRCNNYRYKYIIKDKGGRYVVTVD